MEEQNIENRPEQKKPRSLLLPVVFLAILAAAIIFFGFIVKAPVKMGSATLSWNANTESDLAGYKIYYGTSSRTGDCPSAGYPNKVNVGKTDTPDKPAYTLKDLAGGKTYYFSVTSYDAAGNESCFSPEMQKTMAKTSWSKAMGNFFGKR